MTMRARPDETRPPDPKSDSDVEKVILTIHLEVHKERSKEMVRDLQLHPQIPKKPIPDHKI